MAISISSKFDFDGDLRKEESCKKQATEKLRKDLIKKQASRCSMSNSDGDSFKKDP